VRTFSERYPAIRIRVIDEAAGQTLNSVATGECDFGISFMGSQIPGVDFEPIHTDPFVLAMPGTHAWAKRKALSWADLGNERLISVARSSGNRQLLDDALAKAGHNPSYVFEVSHIATLLGMVEAGLGLAAVPRLALPRTHTSLVGVTLREPSVARQLGLATRHGAALSAPSQIFYDHLRAALLSRK
jgi:DNA-binding transcriptional LysR family regulator